MEDERTGFVGLEVPPVTDDPALELVRRGFAAFNRRDHRTLLGLCHPEIEWRPMRPGRSSVHRGHAGVRLALAEVEEDFEGLHNDPRDLALVGDAVVVTGRLLAKERGTGVRVDRPAAWVCAVRDRLIATMYAFPDGPAAHAAARRRLGP